MPYAVTSCFGFDATTAAERKGDWQQNSPAKSDLELKSLAEDWSET